MATSWGLCAVGFTAIVVPRLVPSGLEVAAAEILVVLACDCPACDLAIDHGEDVAETLPLPPLAYSMPDFAGVQLSSTAVYVPDIVRALSSFAT